MFRVVVSKDTSIPIYLQREGSTHSHRGEYLNLAEKRKRISQI